MHVRDKLELLRILLEAKYINAEDARRILTVPNEDKLWADVAKDFNYVPKGPKRNLPEWF